MSSPIYSNAIFQEALKNGLIARSSFFPDSVINNYDFGTFFLRISKDDNNITLVAILNEQDKNIQEYYKPSIVKLKICLDPLDNKVMYLFSKKVESLAQLFLQVNNHFKSRPCYSYSELKVIKFLPEENLLKIEPISLYFSSNGVNDATCI